MYKEQTEADPDGGTGGTCPPSEICLLIIFLTREALLQFCLSSVVLNEVKISIHVSRNRI